MVPTHARPAPSAFLSLILATAAWGLGAVVSKRAVAEIPPFTLLAIQLAVSVLFLAIALRLLGLPVRDRSARPGLGRLGLLNPGIAYGLSLLGLVHVTASLSVLLWAVEPLLIALLAGLVLGERIGGSLIALLLVAVAGVTFLVGQAGGAGDAIGVGLTLAGVACCAVYTVAARRWLGTADATAPVVATQQAWALGLAVVLALASIVVDGPPRLETVSLAGWASAIGSGVVYYGLAYLFYLSALRRMPASVAAASFYLVPVFGVAGAFAILGERLTTLQWLGAAIVLFAVVGVIRRLGERESGPVAAAVS